MALDVGGRVETSERDRKFVKLFLNSIPTSKAVRAIRPRRLQSSGVFVTGMLLDGADSDVVRHARAAFFALERLCRATTRHPLWIVRLRLRAFNLCRLEYMKSFHEWRRDEIDALLEEAGPLYRQLLLLRSADAEGASSRLNYMLTRMTSVIGREEARHWDLMHRRYAANQLASMLGEDSSTSTISPPQDLSSIVVGARVRVKDLGTGTVRFVGETDFGIGTWAGIELRYPVGRNDGSVRGKRYFTCTQGHGIFLRPKTLLKQQRLQQQEYGEDAKSQVPSTEEPSTVTTTNNVKIVPREATENDFHGFKSLFVKNECMLELGRQHGNAGWMKIGEAYIENVLNTELASWTTCRRRFFEDMPGSKLWVLDLDGVIVGSVGAIRMKESNEMELVRMYVDASCRGRGYGRLLVSHLMKHARDSNVSRVVLTTPTVNVPAIGFYRKMGFALDKVFGAVIANESLNISQLSRPVDGVSVSSIDEMKQHIDGEDDDADHEDNEPEHDEDADEDEDEVSVRKKDDGEIRRRRRRSSSRAKSPMKTPKRPKSPFKVIPPAGNTTSNPFCSHTFRPSSSSTSTSPSKPAWLSSGISSGGEFTSCGSDTGGPDRVRSGGERRRRQSMARSLANSLTQRMKAVAASMGGEQSLVHELIMNKHFRLTLPPESNLQNQGWSQIIAHMRSGDMTSCLGTIDEITNALTSLAGARNGDRTCVVSAMRPFVDALASAASSVRIATTSSSSSSSLTSLARLVFVWFVRVGETLLKLQSPAYDDITRKWITGWNAALRATEELSTTEEMVPKVVHGFRWVARRISTIRIESVNHILHTQLKPLLQGRGGVDYERRTIQSHLRSGVLMLEPVGTTVVHKWLAYSVRKWCRGDDAVVTTTSMDDAKLQRKAEKRRVRDLLLQRTDALESVWMSSFLDMVLPPIKTPAPSFYSSIPVTLALDRSRIALLRNKLHGMCVKATLASIVEQSARSLYTHGDDQRLPERMTRVYERFEGLLLAKSTGPSELASQVFLEIRYCLLPADVALSSTPDSVTSLSTLIREAPTLTEETKSRVSTLTSHAFDPTKAMLRLIVGRLRRSLLIYLKRRDSPEASQSALRESLQKTRMSHVRSDIERLARPTLAFAGENMRAGRSTSRAAGSLSVQSDRSSAASTEGLLRRLMCHHWDVHAPYYAPIVVSTAQERAKELL